MDTKISAAEAGNRRTELLIAASQLFREKGYSATTIRDIAGAVGMRSGSPFYHFSTKQDILKAVMVRGFEHGVRAIESVAAAEPDPERRLRAMVRTHVELILNPQTDINFVRSEWRSLDEASRPEVVAAKDRYEQPWRSVLAELAARNRLHGETRLAHLFAFGLLNSIPQWFRPDGGVDATTVADLATDMILRESAP